MTKKISNELDIDGDVQSNGDLNIGNNIEKQEINIQVNNGISEQRLREVIHAEIELELKNQQILAEDKAREKLLKFSEYVLPKLVKAEMIDAFSDPTIQMFYREIQKTAICSERELDYSVLSELLVYRINNKGNFEKKASITKAVEIVDKISDDALISLTIKYCQTLLPVSGNILEGLNALEKMYKNILKNFTLPENQNWIDNVEILGVVRIESMSTMLNLEDIYYNSLSGYVSKGIDKNSELYKETINKLQLNNLPIDILVNHELNPNYVRLNIVNKDSIRNNIIRTIWNCPNEKSICEVKILTDKQIQILEEIYESYANDKTKEKEIKDIFVKKLNSYPNISKVLDWWNSNTEPAMILNSTGRVLAHTNAKRLYDEIPDMV